MALKRHGHAGRKGPSPTYVAWACMRRRCSNPNTRDYANYGGRGITACARWSLFENFLADMGEKPVGLTLERNDNAQGYGPDNCRWATRQDQNRNRRSVRQITHDGRTQSLQAWANETGLNPRTISSRLGTLGWSVERALSTASRS